MKDPASLQKTTKMTAKDMLDRRVSYAILS